MREKHKERLGELAGEDCYSFEGFLNEPKSTEYLYILIKAMWAINKTSGYNIFMNGINFTVLKNGWHDKWFYFEKYNNSEQEALVEALTYVFDNTK